MDIILSVFFLIVIAGCVLLLVLFALKPSRSKAILFWPAIVCGAIGWVQFAGGLLYRGLDTARASAWPWFCIAALLAGLGLLSLPRRRQRMALAVAVIPWVILALIYLLRHRW